MTPKKTKKPQTLAQMLEPKGLLALFDQPSPPQFGLACTGFFLIVAMVLLGTANALSPLLSLPLQSATASQR